MNANKEPPSIRHIFFRYEKGSKRARLHFEAIEQRCPELAVSVLLIRDRAKDLDAKFYRDAKWALRWFTGTTIFTFTVAAGAIFIGVCMNQNSSECADLGGLTSPAVAFGAFAALVAAGVQAFGWHKQYGAIIAARWAMNALVTQIDQETLEIVLTVADSKKLTDKSREQLHKALANWRMEFASILSKFGKTYGAAFESMRLSKQ